MVHLPKANPSSLDTAIIEPEGPQAQVVHLPLPGDLQFDQAERTDLLRGVSYLLLVGSPARARKVAQQAEKQGATVGCYVDLTRERRNESEREFALYVVRLPCGAVVGVVSHGVGLSGVEIVLSEVPALLAVVEGNPVQIRGVIRGGTRGGLVPVPLGTVALSTAAADVSLGWVEPDPRWLDHVRQVAQARGMAVVGGAERGERLQQQLWPQPPPHLLVEGPGVSTTFFWTGQGRPLYRPQLTEETAQRGREERLAHLVRLADAGVCWLEMEDFTVLRLCHLLGYPAVTLGAVIANRRRVDGTFQVDYNHEAYRLSELLPTELAMAAFERDYRLAHQA